VAEQFCKPYKCKVTNPDKQSLKVLTTNSFTNFEPQYVCIQGLTGTLPDMGSAVASKLTAFRVDNTGLEQCRPNHLAALGSSNYTGKVHLDCLGIILAV